ncbi:hypothetical protein N7462_001035 [Penicillium macrosclerotiorum]|uniref:uncharacterized protein n=1 Tax=Penicillium macrosclerotiorum TaxID=303699 RepID=UPI0025488E1C|nr:uncharacterized protein N7462_001035 [Penicillium macrosclerotiorum]KAJ5699030.1 hypothetical protein N7462_001035 [Penicillium macrosclerotiorum]
MCQIFTSVGGTIFIIIEQLAIWLLPITSMLQALWYFERRWNLANGLTRTPVLDFALPKYLPQSAMSNIDLISRIYQHSSATLLEALQEWLLRNRMPMFR